MGREKSEVLGFGFEQKVEERAQVFGFTGKRPYGHFRLTSCCNLYIVFQFLGRGSYSRDFRKKVSSFLFYEYFVILGHGKWILQPQ